MMLLIVLTVAGVAMSMHLPPGLILPGLSILMVLAGFCLAAVLYVAGYRLQQGPFLAWEIAAALVFFGFAGSMLTDSEQALSVLQQMETSSQVALPR
jgi:hypothetical protein